MSRKRNYINNPDFLAALKDHKEKTDKWKESGSVGQPPRPSDYIGDAIYKIATNYVRKPMFSGYCVDEKTEALTHRGWLSYKDIQLTDKILCCDPKDFSYKWSTIKDIYVSDYDGMMFHLKNKSIDALVTPGHKFLTVDGNLVKVEHLRQKNRLVIMGTSIKTETKKVYSDSFVSIVGWAVTEGSYKLGKHTHSVVIYQKKPNHVKTIENLLNNLDATYTKTIETEDKVKDHIYENENGRIYTATTNKKGMCSFYVTKKIANDIIKVAPSKVISQDFIQQLTDKQRLLLIGTMIDGDGHKTHRKTGTVGLQYYQKDKQHIDSFISLCTQSGIKTKEKEITLEGPFGKFTTIVVTLWGSVLYDDVNKNVEVSCIESINFHGAKRKLWDFNRFRGVNHKNSKLTEDIIEKCKALNSQGVSYKKLEKIYDISASTIHLAVTGKTYNKKIDPEPEHIPNIPYKGTVWCPTTEYGTFVCRRNGIVYVTGNSYRDELVSDALENCFKYLDRFNTEKFDNPFAYFTQIVHNAFFRRLAIEKKQSYIKMKSFEMAEHQLRECPETSGLVDQTIVQHEGIREKIRDYEEKHLTKKKKEPKKSSVPLIKNSLYKFLRG